MPEAAGRLWKPEEIARIAGGSWIREPGAGGVLDGVSIDTRTLEPGEVFIALRGDRADGHAYLQRAAERGAAVAIVDDETQARAAMRGAAGMGALLVDDTRRALARLAGARRAEMQRAGSRVVGVTGSNGKTTTVRLLHALLSGLGRCHRAPKSFNNDLGVPLTLLGAPRDAETVVCELGINAPGEMAPLAELVRPQVALITSIGRAHLEALGSVDGVAREKAEILRPAERGVIPAGSPPLERALEGDAQLAVKPLVRVGMGDGAERIVDVSEDGGGRVGFWLDGERYTVPLAGPHNAANAAMAIVATRAIYPEAKRDELQRGLDHVEAPDMRGTRTAVHLERGAPAATLINDAYNANPESMAAAIRLLARERPATDGRRIAVLGDMLELGDASAAAHREIGALLFELGAADRIVLVGAQMRAAAESVPRSMPSDAVRCVEHLDGDSAARIAAEIAPGDVVLLKGSRRMRLERIAEALQSRPGAREAGSAGEYPPASDAAGRSGAA